MHFHYLIHQSFARTNLYSLYHVDRTRFGKIMKNLIHYCVLIVAARYFTTIVSAGSQTGDDGSQHECSRPCVELVGDAAAYRSKICAYKFFVGKGTSGGGNTMQRVINGTSPGPPIEICLGDTIEVIVENGLSSEELSFHWHGLRQVGSPHMDGVSMISQCPIMPYTSFRYEIKPEKIGTYFYHAHSVRQQGDGLYGSLTVRGSRDDPNTEIILVAFARPSSQLSELVHLDRPIPQALLINGQMRAYLPSIKVATGRKYLIRLINANVFNCPVLFFVAEHNLDIIATDAHSLAASITTKRILIFPGERFNVAIVANQTPGAYVVGFQGFEDCTGLTHEASLNYHDSRDNDDNNFESGRATIPASIHRDDKLYVTDTGDRSHHRDRQLLSSQDHCTDKFDVNRMTFCSLDLVAAMERTSNLLTAESRDGNEGAETMMLETHYIPFDVNSYDGINDYMTDYSFNIYDFLYYPSYLSSTNSTRIGQVNRMTFEYPSSPIFSQPEAVPEDTLCSIDKRAKLCNKEEQFFCQCTQILQLPAWTTADIVLVDQGFGGNISHTFHVHGYDVEIVEIGQFDEPTRIEEMVKLLKSNERHKKRRDTAQLLRKDTFVVPNKGYIILRIYTDNIGYWLWEARSSIFYDGNNEQPPMQFVMLVGNRESLPTVPIDFPTCGNHKSPASIFEDTN